MSKIVINTSKISNIVKSLENLKTTIDGIQVSLSTVKFPFNISNLGDASNCLTNAKKQIDSYKVKIQNAAEYATSCDVEIMTEAEEIDTWVA